MNVQLIRHGKTHGNETHCYIGRTDEPLSEAGIARLRSVSCKPRKEVFVTPLQRTAETASILFPGAKQTVLPDLREMDFGIFEGKNADQMASDDAYRQWVEGWCLAPCPGGESRAQFSGRVCNCFETKIRLLLQEGREDAVFVLHGGSIMAILEAYGQPKQDYYSYQIQNGEAYFCAAQLTDGALALTGLHKGVPE